MANNVKSYNTNLIANIKSLNTNLAANIKSINTNSFSVSPTFPSSDLVAYYKLDETSGTTVNCANNSSYNGTSTSCTVNEIGIISKAYSFNGATPSYITITNNDVFNFGTGNFTINFWIKADLTSGTQTFFHKWAGGEENNGYIFCKENGGAFIFILWNNSANSLVTCAAAEYTNNSWGMFTVKRTSGTLSIDINAVNKVSEAKTERNISNTANITLGKYGLSPLTYTGLMDEMGIWNRALTADEITALYNSGNGLTYAT